MKLLNEIISFKILQAWIWLKTILFHSLTTEEMQTLYVQQIPLLKLTFSL